MPDKQQPAILLLEDGTLCHGYAFGHVGTATGEICFNTGMTGYQEVFTDPSYYGQILIMNTVHVGNYGVKDDEIESDCRELSKDTQKNTHSRECPITGHYVERSFRRSDSYALILRLPQPPKTGHSTTVRERSLGL